MWKKFLILWMAFPLIVLGNDDDNQGLCTEPEVHNGQVTTTKSSGNFRVVKVECDPSYVRVGKALIKCYNGQWSAKIPSCTRIGSCEVRDLPLVDNARRIPVKGFRGSVVKIKCHSHFKLLGEHLAHCVDDKKWSLQEAPVCTRNACDENEMNQIAYGTSTKLHGFRGAVYQFQCDEGATLAGSPTVYCDGKKWNATIPTCISPPGEPDLKVFVDNEPSGRSDSQLVLRAGQHIELRCTARGGNPIPSLTFTKNGQSFGSRPQAYENTYNYVVTPEDHDAVLGCTAQNQADRRADSHEIKLNVLYRPEEATLKVRVDSEPLSLKKSKNVDVKIDQTIEISCIAEGGNPKPLVSVTKNGKSIGKGPQPYQNNYNFVAKVDDHEAKFGCVSKNDFSTTDSSSEIELNVLTPSDVPTVKLNVDSEPVLNTADSPVNIKLGQTIEMSCNVQGGNPEPFVTFTKNGQKIGSKPAQPFKNSYEFVATLDDHNAVFLCSSENENWVKDSSEIKFNVLYPSDEPTLNLSMDSKPLPVTNSIVNIKSGHKIELNCNVQGGNPKPAEIIYTKNGQNIGTGSQAFIFVTHEDQNAILGCSAQNQYWTKDSSELRLNILYPSDEPSLKVKVDSESYNPSNADGIVTLKAGQSLGLSCSAPGGNPKPKIAFTKNGQNFGPEPLLLQNAHNFVVTAEDHDAVLRCSAQNHEWKVDSFEIKLNVLYPPERLTIEGPEELTQDHEARFTCKASASNLPGQLTFKLTSHHADLLDELVNSGLVEIEPLKEKWIDSNDGLENDVHNSGWKTSRSLILKPELLQRAGQLDGQLTFECQVPDPYNERHILKQATTFVALINPVPETQALGLKISGPKQVLFNEQARFKCSANQKDVELDMNVYQDNKNTLKSEIKTFNDGHGEIRLNPGDVEHGTQQFYIECGAYNADKDWDSVKHFVEVLYPPGNPKITGLDHALLSGSEHKLTCVTKAGHPPAKLNWFKGSNMMKSHYTVEGDLVKAEISFVPQPEDNGSQIRCEAVNEAIPKRVSKTLRLDVAAENSNVAGKEDSNIINTSTRTSGTTSEYDDEYAEYDDEYYEYPDTTYSTDDPQFNHPELTDNTLFEGTVNLRTQEDPQRPHHNPKIINPSLDSNTLDIAEKSRTSKNYPRDEAYTGITAGASELSVSLMVLFVSWLALRF